MPRFHRALGCLAVSCALCASSNALAQSAAAPAQSSAPAASRLDEVLAHQSRAHFVSQVAVSPDGKRIAWLQAGQLHVAPYASLAQSLAVTAAASGQACNASQFVWSPDSAAVAFPLIAQTLASNPTSISLISTAVLPAASATCVATSTLPPFRLTESPSLFSTSRRRERSRASC